MPPPVDFVIECTMTFSHSQSPTRAGVRRRCNPGAHRVRSCDRSTNVKTVTSMEKELEAACALTNNGVLYRVGELSREESRGILLATRKIHVVASCGPILGKAFSQRSISCALRLYHARFAPSAGVLGSYRLDGDLDKFV